VKKLFKGSQPCVVGRKGGHSVNMGEKGGNDRIVSGNPSYLARKSWFSGLKKKKKNQTDNGGNKEQVRFKGGSNNLGTRNRAKRTLFLSYVHLGLPPLFQAKWNSHFT